MEVKINHDPEWVYSPEEVYKADDLIDDFAVFLDNESKQWIKSIKKEDAIKFIADMWLLSVEIIKK